MYKKILFIGLCAVLFASWFPEWELAFNWSLPVVSAAKTQSCKWDWKEFRQPRPKKGRVPSFLNDIAVINEQEMWAVGYSVRKNSRPLLMRRTPTQWQIEPTLPIRGLLFGIDALSVNDIWAVGTEDKDNRYQAPLVLRYNGTQWQSVSDAALNLIGELYDVKAIAPDNVWAVGYEISSKTGYPTSLIVHWDGTQWHAVPITNQEWWHYYLYGVAAINEHDIWAVGSKTDFDSTVAALFHWDGQTWSEYITPYGGGLNSVSALASEHVWAVGGAGTLMEWDGTNWTRSEVPFVANLASVFAKAPNDIWVAGSTEKNGFVAGFIARWNGTEWTRQFIGSKRTDFKSITAISDNEVAVVGNKAYKSLRVKGVCD